MKLPEEWISDKMQGHSDFLTDLKRKRIKGWIQGKLTKTPNSVWSQAGLLRALELQWLFSSHQKHSAFILPRVIRGLAAFSITWELVGHLRMHLRPSPDLLEQNLHINKIPKWITSRSKFQQDWVRTTHLNLFMCPMVHAPKAYSNKSSFSLFFFFLIGSRL